MKMHSYLVNHNDRPGKKPEINGDKKETEPKVTIIESKEVEKEMVGDNKDAELKNKDKVEPEKKHELTFIDFLLLTLSNSCLRGQLSSN